MGSSKKRRRVALLRSIMGPSSKKVQKRIVDGADKKTCCGLIMNNNNDVLSDDLWIEILVNLPVQSLLRFKAVCKSWHSFIGSPDFVHRHATMEDRSNKLGTFILKYEARSPFHYRNNVDKYSPHFFLLSGDQFEVFKDLGVRPLQKKPRRYDRVRMAGSCHGIVCLHDKSDGDVYLWNPATKKFRRLPKPLAVRPDGHSHRRIDFAAFGFDVKAKDYKVLKMAKLYGSDGRYFYRAQVYSLNTNSWRYIDNPKICALGDRGARYMNGKYYFCGMKDDIQFAFLSFDFGEETFRTIRIMEPTCYLEFIGEKVGYIKTVPGALGGTKELWELNECCGKECLTKRYNLARRDSLKAISKNEEIGILSDCNGLKMRNLVTQEVKELPFLHSKLIATSAEVYKESLVSVEWNGLLYDNNN